jgi:hypothetical protein
MDVEEVLSAADLSWRLGDDAPTAPFPAGDRLAAGADGPVEHCEELDARGTVRRLDALAADEAPHGATVASGLDDDRLHVGVLLRAPPDPGSPGRLLVCGGLAVGAALASVGLPARPRWPDRVVVDGDPWRETPFYAAFPVDDGGLQSTAGRARARTVASVTVDRLDAGRRPQARGRTLVPLGVVASVHVDGEVDPATLVVGVAANLLARWRAVESTAAPLLAEWRSRDATVGRRVRVDRVDGRPATGRVVDLSARGGLRLLPEDARTGDGGGRVEVTVDDCRRVELLPE